MLRRYAGMVGKRWYVLAALCGVCVVLLVGFGICAWQSREDSASCRHQETKTQCFSRLIDNTLDREGLEPAFDTLLSFSREDTSFADSCHANAHELGRAVYRLYEEGEMFEYSPKMAYCGYGFFHGFTEALLGASGNLAEVVQFCEALEHDPTRARGATSACFHGIGHGAVDGTDPRLWGSPRELIAEAMRLCTQLPDTRRIQYVCAAGAYNALELFTQDSRIGLTELALDPNAFCISEPRERHAACFVNMIPAVLRTYQDDIPRALEDTLARIPYPEDTTVDAVTVEELVATSYLTQYVRLAEVAQEKLGEGMRYCTSLSSRGLSDACIGGLVAGIFMYESPDAQIETWRHMCDEAFLGEDEKRACYTYALSHRRLWRTEADAEALCAATPKEFNTVCTSI